MATEHLQSVEGYSIRLAEEQHVSALNSIELAAATIFPAGSLPEHILTDSVPLDVLFAAQREQRLLVVVDSCDSPVGYLLIQLVGDLALLAQMDVHPSHGRKGLGTALIAHGLARIRQMGFDEAYLTTFAHVLWNAPFYRKIGFEIMEERAIPDPIAEILHEERAYGLSDRVAMRIFL